MADDNNNPENKQRNTLLEFIKRTYLPATPTDADIFISTRDLLIKLEEHLCVTIDPEILFMMLEEIGFTYFDIDTMGFVWTMRRRAHDYSGKEG